MPATRTPRGVTASVASKSTPKTRQGWRKRYSLVANQAAFHEDFAKASTFPEDVLYSAAVPTGEELALELIIKQYLSSSAQDMLLRAALAHPDIKEQLFSEARRYCSPRAKHFDTLKTPEQPELYATFVREVDAMLNWKNAWVPEQRARSFAWGIESQVGNMMNAMLQWATADSAPIEVKFNCAVTMCKILHTAVTIRRESYVSRDFQAWLKHTCKWKNYIRLVLERCTDDELADFRGRGYLLHLLDLWEASGREEGYFPDFGKDTIKCFLDRTGGWTAADGPEEEF